MAPTGLAIDCLDSILPPRSEPRFRRWMSIRMYMYSTYTCTLEGRYSVSPYSSFGHVSDIHTYDIHPRSLAWGRCRRAWSLARHRGYCLPSSGTANGSGGGPWTGRSIGGVGRLNVWGGLIRIREMNPCASPSEGLFWQVLLHLAVKCSSNAKP